MKCPSFFSDAEEILTILFFGGIPAGGGRPVSSGIAGRLIATAPCMHSRLLKKRPSAAFPSSFAVQRTSKYASRLRISGALHPDIFEQPGSAAFSAGS